jgi:integrase
MRVGELVRIDLSDVDFTCKPTKIHIRAEITKSGNQRYCFIGQEATDALKAYLEHRQTYLEASIKRTRTLAAYYHSELKNKNDSRVFPFDDGQIRNIWNRLLTHAKLSERDKRTKFHKMHPHTLRKYFRTHMSLSVPVDIVEALMGHEGYLTEVYRRYSIEQLGEQYLKGEQDVSIFSSTSKDLQELRQSDRAKDEKIATMEKRLNELETLKELLQMKLDIEKIKNGKTTEDDKKGKNNVIPG